MFKCLGKVYMKSEGKCLHSFLKLANYTRERESVLRAFERKTESVRGYGSQKVYLIFGVVGEPCTFEWERYTLVTLLPRAPSLRR